jgi:hypothetical protein
VLDGNTLRNRVATAPPETQANLTIVRNGREQRIFLALDEYRTKK